MYASADAKYCSQEKRSVTLMATPFAIDSSIAGTPSVIPARRAAGVEPMVALRNE
jgi:ABC-type lipoprotein release transport system permease subunit